MRKTTNAPGTIHRLAVDSKALAGNRLGDPTTRIVDVYVPHGHDGAGLPLLVDLVGYTAGGPAHTNWKSFTENLPERLDRLIGDGTMAPVVVAFPDCYSRLGGNQYVNSPIIGNYEDFLIAEMLPALETRFACGGTGRRGVFGKSSGGFGSLVHAMRHPDVWAAAASHSGDAGFENLYLPEFPATLRALAKSDNSIEKWLTGFEAKNKIDGKDTLVLMILAQAASFDPDPSAETFLGLRLPVTLDTCELIEDRWQNWLKWDPARMVETHADAIGKLKGFFLDCGTEDQYNILYGTRRIHRTLEAKGIAHRYEEFPDNHSSVDYRMDISLPFLAEALSK
ncbi:esterase family protein [Devosia sp. XJ19-1]|uniref:Esterase family protein n=1 Tax=Devosia ureilytica TaxID=2952754 RepID=A0A9Q4FTY9_9HYPH|nr:alpha/beta hydrolase-fold protein [Devosia ureilytica]MCP8884752.1 esterase family protein [Devosia ureilytica]MCP8888383.1 esterase family protein [Devosia ureilytica]